MRCVDRERRYHGVIARDAGIDLSIKCGWQRKRSEMVAKKVEMQRLMKKRAASKQTDEIQFAAITHFCKSRPAIQ